jgi:hypothetical protein
MDALEVVKLLANAPMSLLLLYLLINEQRRHAETRAQRDKDNAERFERVAGLVEKVTDAINELTFRG